MFYLELAFLLAVPLVLAGALYHQHQLLTRLLMNQAELAAALTAANTELAKIRKEQNDRAEAQSAAIVDLTQQVAALKKAIEEGGTVSQETALALLTLQNSLQSFDDTIPDLVETPATPNA